MTSKEISDARKKRTKSFALDDNLIGELENSYIIVLFYGKSSQKAHDFSRGSSHRT